MLFLLIISIAVLGIYIHFTNLHQLDGLNKSVIPISFVTICIATNIILYLAFKKGWLNAKTQAQQDKALVSYGGSRFGVHRLDYSSLERDCLHPLARLWDYWLYGLSWQSPMSPNWLIKSKVS